jgi:hypothetical protein
MQHNPDLTVPVLFGLAWYYLLAAMMNAAAAAYVSYGEMVSEGASRPDFAAKTRRLPPWLITTYLALYGLAVLIILLHNWLPGAPGVAYALCAVANTILAVMAAADAAHFSELAAHRQGDGSPPGPSSLDDHQPAVGLGKPINRTLWTVIWGVVSVLFQAMGIAYMLSAVSQSGQSEQIPVTGILMPLFVRDAIDGVAGPTTFFVGATLGFIALLRWRRFIANGLVGWSIVNVFLLFFGLSMTDYDFRDIVTKPDNVPIVGLLILVGCFFWFGLRRAVINDSRIAQGLPSLEASQPDKTLTWPDLVYTELICMVLLTILLVVWGIALQAPLEQPASSTVAPNPSKAPWYFLGLQEMLVYFDPWMAGVVLPSLIIVGLMAIPYIDTNKAGNGYYTFVERKFAFITFQYGFVVLWVTLIMLGTFLRGPNWNFFGPYEHWDLHKVIPLNNVNLSDIVWVQLLGTSKPASIFLREAPGLILCLAYLPVMTYLLYKVFFKKYCAQAGWVRFLTLSFLLLFMASLPIKMVLRWTINLKYLIAIPEYFFNI